METNIFVFVAEKQINGVFFFTIETQSGENRIEFFFYGNLVYRVNSSN